MRLFDLAEDLTDVRFSQKVVLVRTLLALQFLYLFQRICAGNDFFGHQEHILKAISFLKTFLVYQIMRLGCLYNEIFFFSHVCCVL